MKFNIYKSDLLTCIKIPAMMAKSKKGHEIYKQLLVQCKGNTLKSTGSNGNDESFSYGQINESNTESFEFLVEAAKFSGLINSFDETKLINIELNDTHVIIKQGRSRHKLAKQDPKNYPIKPTINEQKNSGIEVDANLFFKAIERVFFTMGVNDARGYLNTMCIEINGEKGEISFLSTNGQRASFYSLLGTISSSMVNKCLIHRDTIKNWMAIKNENAKITIEFNENMCLIKSGFTCIKSANPEFSNSQNTQIYPSKDVIYPSDFCHVVKVNKRELLTAINRIKTTSSSKDLDTMGISITAENNEIIMVEKSSNTESIEVIPCENYAINGQPESNTTILGASYIEQAISKVEDETVVLNIETSDSSPKHLGRVVVGDAKNIGQPMMIMPKFK